MNPTITRATKAHAFRMSRSLRQEDLTELRDLLGTEPLDALLYGVNKSEYSWTWLIDGEPVMMFGIALPDVIGATGVPWALGTPAADRHKKYFMRESRVWLRNFLCIRPHLTNYVDARYTKAIRWLTWLGFTIHPAEPIGAAGMPYHRFEITRT